MVELGKWPSRRVAETDRLLVVVPDGSYAKRMREYAVRNREYHRLATPTPPLGWEKRTYWHKRLVSRLTDYRHRRAYGFVLLKKDDPKGPIVGDCTFSQVFRGPLEAAVLGYKVDEGHAGKGYMREGLEAALQFMFSGVLLHRIEANVRPENERSFALLKRLGFVLEGFSRSYLKLDGEWMDHLRLAIIHPEAEGGSVPDLDLAKLGVPVPNVTSV